MSESTDFPSLAHESPTYLNALAAYVKDEDELDYVPDVVLSWWTAPWHGTCGEGTCDYDSPVTFTIEYARPGERETGPFMRLEVTFGEYEEGGDGFAKFLCKLLTLGVSND